MKIEFNKNMKSFRVIPQAILYRGTGQFTVTVSLLYRGSVDVVVNVPNSFGLVDCHCL